MNVVDSSGWLEYFAEVFKRVHQQRGEHDALKVVAQMLQGQVIDLDTPLALRAAKVSIDFGLPMADSIILATALAFEATLWTQDEHFKMIDGVRYVEKQKAE